MIDRAVAAQLLDEIGPAGLGAVAAAFRGDLARLLAALEQAAAAGDGPAFRRAAHGLAGAAGSVGATTLERACRAAMVPAAAGRPALLEAIRAAAGPAEDALRQALVALAPSG